MNYTSAEASKLLKKLNDELLSIIAEEDMSVKFTASINEDIESVRPAYNYEETQEREIKLENSIRALRHAINVFNATTVIPEFNITIDEMLVLIPQLTRRKNKLSGFSNQIPKKRAAASYSNIIDYHYVNYDIGTARRDYMKVSDELSRAQLALDKVNHSVKFNFDLD